MKWVEYTSDFICDHIRVKFKQKCKVSNKIFDNISHTAAVFVMNLYFPLERVNAWMGLGMTFASPPTLSRWFESVSCGGRQRTQLGCGGNVTHTVKRGFVTWNLLYGPPQKGLTSQQVSDLNGPMKFKLFFYSEGFFKRECGIHLFIAVGRYCIIPLFSG